MKNIFAKNKKPFWKKENKQDQYIRLLQQLFLFLAIFLAGYIVATVQYVLY